MDNTWTCHLYRQLPPASSKRTPWMEPPPAPSTSVPRTTAPTSPRMASGRALSGCSAAQQDALPRRGTRDGYGQRGRVVRHDQLYEAHDAAEEIGVRRHQPEGRPLAEPLV